MPTERTGLNGSPYDFDSRRIGDPSGIEPIAIVGAACRLPGAPDLDALARLLINGVDAVSEIPDDRWNKAQLYHPDRGQRGKAYTFAAGVIDNVAGFDPAFFGISPREAVQMDPQQRLCLELAYEAIEDAGIDAGRLAGEPVGVFVGGSSWDYLNLHVADPASTDAYSMTGVTLCSLSNRISYAFDLRGPSFTVDTACSSSLVALHQACEAIRAGQVPVALVGGVSLLLAPQSFVGFCQASMLSPNGRCHAFDARADGYVRAEGGGFVVLKPLGDALAAGDPIRAIIRGTGVNSDGRTTGFSLPNRDAQGALLEQVYSRFRLDPNDLAYVEAHGTGTPAGDPIEAGALGAMLGRKRSAPLPIGSIKSNIGHLEAASGMAGLLKAMLVAEGGVIPPSLHCATPNPNIPFDELNLALVPQPIVLPDDQALGRLIGINSFGFGGTNAHAVLETPIQPILASGNAVSEWPPLLLSAQSEAALQALAGEWRGMLDYEPDAALPALLRGAALHRRQHKQRAAIGAPDRAALGEALEALTAGRSHPLMARDSAVSGKVGFVFSGNGSQWAGMAADAIAYSAEFRAGLKIVDAALTPWLGWSVAAALAAPQAEALRDTATAQPLLFAIQVALVTALREHGVEAQGWMGHSVGEVAAAWAAGALDLDGAARVIAARSQAQQARHGIGGMAVLGIDAEAVAIALASAPLAGSGIEIAAHNSGQATTVAGPADALALLDAVAKKQGWRFVRLDLEYAFHSAAMDPIEQGLRTDLAGLAPRAGQGFFSTVTGDILAGDALDAGYWWRNVRDPVLFADAAEAMVAAGIRIFVEIGPHPVVRAYLSEALRSSDKEGRVIPTLARRQLPSDPVAMIALRCHAAGADIRHAATFHGPTAVKALPRYPWQREHFWLDRTAEASDPFVLPFAHPLLGYAIGDDAREWRQHVALELQPWLADHVVGGAAVVPAAALLDMALAAGRARSPNAAGLELFDAEIGRALVLEPGMVRELRLRIGSAAGDFELLSRPRLSDEAWTIHMRGRLGEADSDAPATAIDLDPPIGRIGSDALYALAAGMGLEYGPAFRAVRGVDLQAENRGRTELVSTGRHQDGFLIAPDLVDGALQGLLALAAERLGTAGGVMPWRFGRVRLLRPAGAVPASARMRLTRIGPRSVRADVALLDADDDVVAELLDCWFVRVALQGPMRIEDMTFHTALVDAAAPGDAASTDFSPADLLAGIEQGEASDAELLADAFISAAAAEAARNSDSAACPDDALLQHLTRWLDEDGLLATDQSEGADQPPAAAILQSLMLDQPRAIAEVAILAEAAAALPERLRDGGAAGAIAPALWDQLLYDSPSGVAAGAALSDIVARLVAAQPPGRSLRILQIGARRGRYTGHLLRRLDGQSFELVAATDGADLPPLADMLDRRPGVRAVAADAIVGGPFDLVVGLHAGAALPPLPAFASGATIVLADPAPNRMWTLIGADGPVDPARLATLGFENVESRTMHGGVWPIQFVAARAPTVAAKPSIGAWSLIAPAGRLADAICAAAPAQGGSILRVDNDPAIAGSRMVMLLSAAPARLADQLTDIARLAGAISADEQAEIVLVLRASATAVPVAAALNGTRRVLANEAANVRCRLIRIDPALPDAVAAKGIVRELSSADGEDEIALTPRGRRVSRVRRGLPPPVAKPEALRLAIGRPGLLDTLGWEEAAPGVPGPGEIGIRIEAAGLNFRDVMWAMGLLPDEALLDGFAGATLGLECAGVVSAVGPDVTRFAPGDRVMAFAPASLGTHTVTQAHAVMPMPEDMDFAAAATVPVAFLTVAYAVGHLARLQEGETILIHGGAGGVGLAAIQYARARGARIFATAGSPAKRALLSQLDVEAVFDSRSLSFADDVLRATGGEGVDVVLNSLAGEAMRRSLGLLKPFGRFLELGKRDFYENSAIGLRPFRHNVTYFGIDADQLPLKQPKLAQALFDEIADLFADGQLHPLPHRQFDFAEVEDAFRLMQGSGHIGKIVLAPGATLPAVNPVVRPFVAQSDAAYLVTGGLDGFGLETVRWLSRHGARRLALISRRGPATPGAADVLASFANEGIDARAYACDVGDEAALAATLNAIRTGQGSIGGVVHAAVAMDDALLPQLDADRFARALHPKLAGAEALDRLTRNDPVSLFLLFSSVTTPMGNPGQGNYVAANAAIEAVAERRHGAGLPALAVQWGPIGDAGYLSREKDVSDLLSRQLGSGHMTAAQALDTLPALLAAGLPVAGVATVRWGSLKNRLPLLASPLFAEIGATAGDDAAEVDLRALLASCSPEEAREKTTALLIEEVARIMKLAPDRVEAQRPLAELGMDSLMAVELRLAVEQRFGVSVPLLALSEGATLSAMAGRILRGLGGEETADTKDEAGQLADRIRRFEGAEVEGPAGGATEPTEPSFAAAASNAP